MMEVGIFRKDLHTLAMRMADLHDEIDAHVWVELADGHEVVFDDSNAQIGIMQIVNATGNIVELAILREWCNNFCPMSEL